MSMPEPSLYDRFGGQPFFDTLVDDFYDGVAADPLLRPMYREDLTEAKRHLAWFLAQYWGGPPRYGEERGHPRLRMRHAPFVIGEPERAAWLRHMSGAIRKADLPPDLEDRLLDYVTMAAAHMVNRG